MLGHSSLLRQMLLGEAAQQGSQLKTPVYYNVDLIYIVYATVKNVIQSNRWDQATLLH